MKRKLAVFGLAFSLAELAAAYLPSPAGWLGAAFAVAGAGWGFRGEKLLKAAGAQAGISDIRQLLPIVLQ